MGWRSDVPTFRGRRRKGLWVVMTKPPGPSGEFVELEDEQGRGVGPADTGVTWMQEGEYWLLGPFRPAGEFDPDADVALKAIRDMADEAMRRDTRPARAPESREGVSEAIGGLQETCALLRGALGSPDLNLTRERLVSLADRLSAIVGGLG